MDEPTADTFEYKPLEDNETSFRLLRLCPRRGSDIQCQLEQADILHCGPYEALSYAWGLDEKVEPITVNGRTLWITDNLYTALQHLAYSDNERMIWVDGVCINQDDSAEKSLQVQRMRHIYSQAANVIFWLGKATLEILRLVMCAHRFELLLDEDYTLDQARALWPSLLETQKAREDVASGLQTLLCRPWFKRVWILQEVAYARCGTICAGPICISAETFALFTSLLQSELSGPSTYWQPVVDIMPGLLRKQSWWAQTPDLYTLYQRFCDSNATDSRDKIYALLGLSEDERDRDAIVVDYAKPLHEVLEEALRHFLHSETSRADHILNVAASYPGIATVLVVVQEDTDSTLKVEFFNCQQKTLETDPEMSWWLRSRCNPEADDSVWPYLHGLHEHDTYGVLDIPTVAIRKQACHIVMQQLEPSLDNASESSLYSEVLSMLPAEVYNYDVHRGRPDVGHWGGKEEHVKILVLEKALVSRLLEFAVNRGFINLLQLLLDLELLDLQDDIGSNIIYQATKIGNEAMLDVVLDVGYKLDGGRITALQRAAAYGEIGVMETLIERGANVNAISEHGRNALSQAVWSDQTAPFDLLVEKGADCETNARAIIDACEGEWPRLWAVEHMLESGAEPDFVLYVNMLTCQEISAIVMALDHGANANCLATSLNGHGIERYITRYVGQSMLQLAARRLNSTTEVMKTLLDRGADINLVSKDGNIKTALHTALYRDHVANAMFLLERGAHVDRRAYKIIERRQSQGKYSIEGSYEKLQNLLHQYDSSKKDYQAPTMPHREDYARGDSPNADTPAAQELSPRAQMGENMKASPKFLPLQRVATRFREALAKPRKQR